MSRAIKIIALVGGVAALALLVASASPASTQAKHAKKIHKVTVQHVKIVIKSDEEHGKKGSDGKWHDSFLPANFNVLAGVPTKVTVVNYDEMPHSFTSSALHLNVLIPAAKGNTPGTVTFTFTAKKAGKYLWWCNQPCDPWAMAHIGYMRGYVNVVA